MFLLLSFYLLLYVCSTSFLSLLFLLLMSSSASYFSVRRLMSQEPCCSLDRSKNHLIGRSLLKESCLPNPNALSTGFTNCSHQNRVWIAFKSSLSVPVSLILHIMFSILLFVPLSLNPLLPIRVIIKLIFFLLFLSHPELR